MSVIKMPSRLMLTPTHTKFSLLAQAHSLYGEDIGDEGVCAIAEALRDNATVKEL